MGLTDKEYEERQLQIAEENKQTRLRMLPLYLTEELIAELRRRGIVYE